MAKECSKNELFDVERQALESYMSAFEEMKKVKFRISVNNQSGN